jgi:hypothetical protein
MVFLPLAVGLSIMMVARSSNPCKGSCVRAHGPDGERGLLDRIVRGGSSPAGAQLGSSTAAIARRARWSARGSR